jgi:SNF2 family DNA or RNA helicase
LASRKKPFRLFDLEALELIFGPPERIYTWADFESYQKWMARLCVNLKYVYLGADMGLGKTATALKAISVWLNRGKCKKVLIVAPLNVANYTWPEEIAKWDFARPLKYSVITGTEEERIRALNRDAQVYIVNRENVVWLYKHLNPHETPEELENPNWPF